MKNIIIFICIGISFSGFSQKSMSKLLKQYNKESIPYISVEVLKNEKSEVILLDSREEKEYHVSHIKDAIRVGYDFFNLDTVQQKLPNKDSKIVVYCSIGVRSEDIAEKLKKAGYNNVYNLYGGIFEWKSNDNKVYNSGEKETDSIHTFSKEWSKWLRKGTKVYD
ncbi:MAG: rhodanese-like domain-containing protein [Flavobacteriaceae bacterium]|mgnify:CR=1 FL=1|tara:strand:+ start:2414 stop:2908 length:495 start_codon:yes stop_codon:yes gene_type:complete